MEAIIKKEINEQCPIQGRIVVRSHKAGDIERYAKSLLHPFESGFSLNDQRKVLLNDYIISSGLVVAENHNLIMTAPNLGRDLLVQFLLGNLATGASNAAYNVGINWGAIGTGTTTPTATDTQLTAETNRSAVLFAQDQSYNVAAMQFFFPDGSIVNQTYNEFGSFVAGTSTANSGQMFNHALFNTPYVKTSGTDLTVQLSITLS